MCASDALGAAFGRRVGHVELSAGAGATRMGVTAWLSAWAGRSGARPGEALEARPEGGPVAGGGLGDDQGDAAGVEEDAAADAQHALAEAAQAPARPGGDLQGARRPACMSS